MGGDEKELTSAHVLFHAERLFKTNEENLSKKQGSIILPGSS